MEFPNNERACRRRQRLQTKPSAGFTLIEVALAATVMALSISTAIVALQFGFRNIDVARGNTLASQIMQSEIERLRLLPWNNPTTPVTTIDSIKKLPASEALDLATMFSSNVSIATRFTATRTVTTYTPAPTRNARYITITVVWTTSDRRSHTRSFTTMYAENGLYDYYYTTAGGT